ncbi:MAG: cell wall hydrolase [Pseudomonadota bacterium]
MNSRQSSILGSSILGRYDASFGKAAATPPVIRLPDASVRPIRPVPRPTRKVAQEAQAEAAISAPEATAPRREPRFSLRKRLAVLLAAIAVPAMAAPGDFGAVAADAPDADQIIETQIANAPTMPFEQKGMSFPGSAFYYLADPPRENLVALPTGDPSQRAAFGGLEVGAAIETGPAAAPFTRLGSGMDKARAMQCLAQAVWYEAASESEAGQRAVAQVVLNRVAHSAWPSSVCGVVYEGSQRSTGCQFSFTCDGSLARRAGGATWARAQRIAESALSGDVYAPVGLATHYHTRWVNPYWASSLDHVGTIGAHIFYRNRGRAGTKAAFSGVYAGAEPLVRGRTSRAPSGGESDIASVGAFIPAQAIARTATPASAPASPAQSAPNPAVTADADLADPSLREAGQARAQYANAGQWKKDPATLDLPSKQSAPQD